MNQFTDCKEATAYFNDNYKDLLSELGRYIGAEILSSKVYIFNNGLVPPTLALSITNTPLHGMTGGDIKLFNDGVMINYKLNKRDRDYFAREFFNALIDTYENNITEFKNIPDPSGYPRKNIYFSHSIKGRFSRLMNKFNNFSKKLEGDKWYLYETTIDQSRFGKPVIMYKRVMYGPFDTLQDALNDRHNSLENSVALGDELINWENDKSSVTENKLVVYIK